MKLASHNSTRRRPLTGGRQRPLAFQARAGCLVAGYRVLRSQLQAGSVLVVWGSRLPLTHTNQAFDAFVQMNKWCFPRRSGR